ncbi:hypothetical protein [Croceicoccus bisphenolivorans]|uniref:hypothetical protein n=1 Tax=Croceicoccus bisphenolivorans TaxID=1783232 RepID=UPI00082A0356|nr:hypothetical protein [Croceicoccus bisphenolivorans]
MADWLLWTAAASAIAGVGVLRWAWARPQRSRALNATGWGMLALAAAMAGAAAGAWGLAVAALAGMVAAHALLAIAAWRSPQSSGRASNRRAGMLPQNGETLRLGGRLITFVLSVPAGALAALCITVALRAVAQMAGVGEADANVLALFAMPVAWAVLAIIIVMAANRRKQCLTVTLATLPACLIVLAGQYP